ncbi:hypothetical protein HF520_12320 [Romboutsia sp. CE17]|uniref:hypothetical protein n=1 Tax=Romboutsia sp. CE17 TaxID=2724150 RepID=UPI001442D891|nr:hypothetical protein [Romboutsia sp. CE17]QJA09685.1 hypothetical protein HF520_12320 [Romboutsia sp. CE17]
MTLIEKVNLMQGWLRKLEDIKEKRRKKEIDDIDVYNTLNEIIENNKNELISLNLLDVYEYSKEYYLLRIQ